MEKSNNSIWGTHSQRRNVLFGSAANSTLPKTSKKLKTPEKTKIKITKETETSSIRITKADSLHRISASSSHLLCNSEFGTETETEIDTEIETESIDEKLCWNTIVGFAEDIVSLPIDVVVSDGMEDTLNECGSLRALSMRHFKEEASKGKFAAEHAFSVEVPKSDRGDLKAGAVIYTRMGNKQNYQIRVGRIKVKAEGYPSFAVTDAEALQKTLDSIKREIIIQARMKQAEAGGKPISFTAAIPPLIEKGTLDRIAGVKLLLGNIADLKEKLAQWDISFTVIIWGSSPSLQTWVDTDRSSLLIIPDTMSPKSSSEIPLKRLLKRPPKRLPKIPPKQKKPADGDLIDAYEFVCKKAWTSPAIFIDANDKTVMRIRQEMEELLQGSVMKVKLEAEIQRIKKFGIPPAVTNADERKAVQWEVLHEDAKLIRECKKEVDRFDEAYLEELKERKNKVQKIRVNFYREKGSQPDEEFRKKGNYSDEEWEDFRKEYLSKRQDVIHIVKKRHMRKQLIAGDNVETISLPDFQKKWRHIEQMLAASLLSEGELTDEKLTSFCEDFYRKRWEEDEAIKNAYLKLLDQLEIFNVNMLGRKKVVPLIDQVFTMIDVSAMSKKRRDMRFQEREDIDNTAATMRRAVVADILLYQLLIPNGECMLKSIANTMQDEHQYEMYKIALTYMIHQVADMSGSSKNMDAKLSLDDYPLFSEVFTKGESIIRSKLTLLPNMHEVLTQPNQRKILASFQNYSMKYSENYTNIRNCINGYVDILKLEKIMGSTQSKNQLEDVKTKLQHLQQFLDKYLNKRSEHRMIISDALFKEWVITIGNQPRSGDPEPQHQQFMQSLAGLLYDTEVEITNILKQQWEDWKQT